MVECNIILGRFQPWTKGHEKILEELYEQNNLKTLILLIDSNKKDEKHPFTTDLSETIIKESCKDIKDKFLDVVRIKGGDFGKMFVLLNELGFIPKLWGCGTDRFNVYKKFCENIEYRKKYFVTSEAYEIRRCDDDISATKVRNSIVSKDLETFKEMMNDNCWKYFGQLQRQMLND